MMLALLLLLPGVALAWYGPDRRGPLFWLAGWLALGAALLALATGPTLPGGRFPWPAGFGATLWLAIAMLVAAFMTFSLLVPECWRLLPLLAPCWLVLGMLATVWPAPGLPAPAGAPPAWLLAHIFSAALGFALVILAAVAATAFLLRDRALRNRMPPVMAGPGPHRPRGRAASRRAWPAIVARLPSAAGGQQTQSRLLRWSLAVMGASLATGMALQWLTTGTALVFTHKVLFAGASFGVMLLLTVTEAAAGLRGRQAARLILLAGFLLSLGFAGVKFVTDILRAGG